MGTARACLDGGICSREAIRSPGASLNKRQQSSAKVRLGTTTRRVAINQSAKTDQRIPARRCSTCWLTVVALSQTKHASGLATDNLSAISTWHIRTQDTRSCSNYL